MAVQPTSGTWDIKKVYQDDIKDDVLWVHVEDAIIELNVCGIAPIYTSWGKKRTRRDHKKEEANAKLISQAKPMARVLLKLLKAEDEVELEQVKRYAAQVIEAAKVGVDKYEEWENEF